MYCRVVVLPVQRHQRALGWHSTILNIAVSFDVVFNNHKYASSNTLASDTFNLRVVINACCIINL